MFLKSLLQAGRDLLGVGAVSAVNAIFILGACSKARLMPAQEFFTGVTQGD